MSIKQFAQRKLKQEKITMITCYDYASACTINDTDIDAVLIGDSVSMVVHGHPNTTMATMDMMIMHTQAVSRGLKNKLIVGDLPFMSYRKGLQNTLESVQALVQAGAHAIKLEGCDDNLDTIRHIVNSGVPVMGHIGLTPQSVNQLGGFRVQGKTDSAQEKLMQDAKQLEQAGCFAIVLECVPAQLAKEITESLIIPTIGIGAGPDTDGQILVWHDALGLQQQIKPKFLKQFICAEPLIQEAIQTYVSEVKESTYPHRTEHSY